MLLPLKLKYQKVIVALITLAPKMETKIKLIVALMTIDKLTPKTLLVVIILLTKIVIIMTSMIIIIIAIS